MKPDRINLGLAVSGLHSQKGVPRTCDDIASYCGCSRQRIQQIEERALRKLRYKLRIGHPELRELMESLKR